MKLVVIHGSDRKGNTYAVVEEFLNRLGKHLDGKLDIEYIWSTKLALGPCYSCHQCFMSGEKKCPDYEVVKQVADAIVDADGVIFASPTYAMHIPGMLKNLIDHLAYYFHRPSCYDVQGLAISTTAGSGAKLVTKYLSRLMQYFGFNSVLSYPVTLRSEKYELSRIDTNRMDKVAKKFAKRIQAPPQNIDFFTTMNFYIWQRMNAEGYMGEFDQNYWKDKGLLGKGIFANKTPHMLGKMLGKLVGIMIKRGNGNG